VISVATTRPETSTQRNTRASDRKKDAKVVNTLLRRQKRTYAAQAGIRLRDTPAPLYQMLVLANLLSARIKADIAVSAARALFEAGMRDSRSMALATWQERVDALGKGGYRRYDERTSAMLGEGAELLLDQYDGDLRRLREESDPAKALQRFPGIGPTGTDIFLRGVQAIWPEFHPYVDRKALDGARRLGLPASPEKLAGLVTRREVPLLADGLVHAALDKPMADAVLAAADRA
jgi:hypothetical protein